MPTPGTLTVEVQLPPTGALDPSTAHRRMAIEALAQVQQQLGHGIATEGDITRQQQLGQPQKIGSWTFQAGD